MYTGIVNHCGKVKSIQANQQAKRIAIQSQFDDLQVDESIAVNGCCLTITAVQPNYFCADISPETLAVTNLKYLQPGSFVNLERPLRPMDRMGGHTVNGLIDQICQVKSITQQQDFTEIWFAGVTKQHQSYLITKSDIAVNGVSLTIHQIKDDAFQVLLIPHTLKLTNLSQLQLGDAVNIEFDIAIKTIVKTTTNYLKMSSMKTQLSGISG